MNLLSKPLPVLVLCCLVMAVFWLAPQARAELIINEIMGDPNQDWDGDGALSYKDDEWIEVKNVGESTEDLSLYWLRDTTGEDLHLQLSGTLEPGEMVAFYGSDATAWQQEQDITSSGFSINNTGDTIELVKAVPDETGRFLAVVYAVTILDHEAENDRSSGWDWESQQWVMNDSLNPYSGGFSPQGNGCPPTPGEPNICSPLVSVEQTTWGALKSQYR